MRYVIYKIFNSEVHDLPWLSVQTFGGLSNFSDPVAVV